MEYKLTLSYSLLSLLRSLQLPLFFSLSPFIIFVLPLLLLEIFYPLLLLPAPLHIFPLSLLYLQFLC